MTQTSNLTLLILAAGVGSRYGGLKQLDRIGPNGECLMEYSIYDAIRSGFSKIVFVIKQDFEEVFVNQIIKKWEKKVAIEYVFQNIDQLYQSFDTEILRQLNFKPILNNQRNSA